MKNSLKLLILGCLVSSIASGLEVDKAAGHFNIKYDYYGKSESYYEPSLTSSTNNGNEGSRLELSGKMSTFKNQWFEYRVREYQNLENKNSSNSKRSTGNDTRVRYYFKHNDIYNNKIGNTTRLEYRSFTSSIEQVSISEIFDLKKLLPEGNDYFKITTLRLLPGYEYRFKGPETDYHVNKLKLDVDYRFVLPYDFQLYGTLYLSQNYFSDEARAALNTTTKNPNTTSKTTVQQASSELFQATLEMYLRKTWNLYKYEDYSVDLQFIGGLDSLGYNGYNSYNTVLSTNERSLVTGKYKASIYAFPHVGVTYKPTNNLEVFGNVGAEYRNWEYQNFQNMRDWEWQARAVVGMNRKF